MGKLFRAILRQHYGTLGSVKHHIPRFLPDEEITHMLSCTGKWMNGLSNLIFKENSAKPLNLSPLHLSVSQKFSPAMKKFQPILLFAFLLANLQLYAQTASIRGAITDALTNEQIIFANVLVLNTD
jgi:hypothetical protein